MKQGVFFFIAVLMTSLSPAAAQRFRVPISVSDGMNAVDLTLGVDPNGTDGFDIGLDQGDLPPVPPLGAFDARYRIGLEDLVIDIRSNAITQKTFTMLYQVAMNQGPTILTWDSTGLSTLGSFVITDDVTGDLFAWDMTMHNTLDVSSDSADGLLDEGLRVLVTPNPPMTLYVATNGNDTGNDCTDPEDPCATIAHAVSKAVNDDTLDLAAGTYNEPGLVIDKYLHVQGQGVIVQ